LRPGRPAGRGHDRGRPDVRHAQRAPATGHPVGGDVPRPVRL